jgi:hypothetical protein
MQPQRLTYDPGRDGSEPPPSTLDRARTPALVFAARSTMPAGALDGEVAPARDGAASERHNPTMAVTALAEA